MTNITQIITALTTFPQRSQYVSSSAYALAVETWLGENQNLSVELSALVPQLNTFVSEANTLSDSVSASESAINQIVNQVVNYRGDWIANYSSGVGYATSESVSYNNKIYYSKIDNNIIEPTSQTSTSSWHYVGSIDEAPMDGHTYGRKNAGWAFVQEIAQTATPTLSGAISVNESTSTDIIITNYSATAGYVINAVSGTVTRVGDTISFVADSVASDKAGSVSVSAVEAGETTSLVAVHNITVVNTIIVSDQALVYNSTTMTEFTTLTNTALTDTNTTLSSVVPIDTTSIISSASTDSFDTTTRVLNGDTVNVDGTDMTASGVIGGSTVGTLDIFGDSSCVALYEFEDNTNDTGGNYNGTATDITYGAGKFNNTVVFNGTSSNVVFPNNIFSAVMSVSVWFKGTDSYIFTNDYTGSGNFGFLTAYTEGGELRVYVSDNSTTLSFFSTGFTDGNQYEHLVISISATELNIYANGVLIDTQAIDFTPVNNGNIAVGRWYYSSNGNVYCKSGPVDQVRAFNKALNQLEVDYLYTESKYTLDTTSVTSGATPTTAYINEHRALSNTITQDAEDTDLAGLTAIQSKLEFENISDSSSVADSLVTYTKISDGDTLAIVKDDNSVNGLVASGVVDNGDGTFTLDTTSVTAGEIPSKAYAVGSSASFEISSGFVEATKISDFFTLDAPTVGMLSITRTHNDVTDLTGSRTLQTKVAFEADKAKLTELTATVQKLG